MKIKTSVNLTSVVWLATIAIFGISLSYFYSLSKSIDDLQKQRDNLTKVNVEIKKSRDDLQSNSILLKNSLYAYGEYIDSAKNIMSNGCDSDWAVRCLRLARYSDLLAFHSRTLILRVSADGESDYVELSKRYKVTPAYINNVSWMNRSEKQRWLAISYEGEAYSDWKVGDLNVANKNINLAKNLYGGSPIIVLTDLKIRCTLRESNDSISNDYRIFKEELRKRMIEKQSQNNIDEANSNKTAYNLFVSDRELIRTCKDARLN